LDSGSLQPSRNDEDLGKSALTKAHGVCEGGKTSTWEACIEKQRPFMMRAKGKTPREGKAPSAQSHEKPGNRGEGTKEKGGTHAPKLVVYQGHPWVVSRFG